MALPSLHPMHILLVEDDEDDYALIRDRLAHLCASGSALRWVADYDDALSALQSGEFDVCLLDYQLGARSGIEFLEEVARSGCPTPVIFLTGTGDYEIDFKAMKTGAADYLTKDKLNTSLLERSMRYAIEIRHKNEELLQSKLMAEKQSAELALRESEDRLRLAMEATDDGVWDWNLRTGEVFRSQGFYSMLGYGEKDFGRDVEAWRNLVHPDDLAEVLRALDEYLQGRRQSYELEYRMLSKSGNAVWILSRGKVVSSDKDGNPERMVGTHTDITERKHAEMKILRLYRQNQLILDAAEEGIIGLDSAGKVTFANRYAVRTLGYSIEEFIGKALHQLIHHSKQNGDPYPLSECPMNESITLGMASRIRNELLWRKDGKSFPSAYSSTPIIEEGNTVGAVINFRDITRRKLAEDALRESEKRFRQLAETIAEVFWLITPDNQTLLYINPAFEKLWGRTCAELYANPKLWLESIHPEDAQQVLDAYEGLAQGGLYDVEYRIVRPDGTVRWINDRGYPVRDSANLIILLSGIASDITERKRAEEEKEALEGRLRQAQKLEAIGTLAGGIAHDFNNILQPMMGYTEMALDELSPSDPTRDMLVQVLNASVRATELVRQILAISRSTQEQEKIQIDISSIIKEALKLLRSSLPTSIEVRQNILMGVALADPTQIHQVLMNLCTNAAHAMDNEGILEVSLSPVDLNDGDLTDQSIPDLRPGPHLKLSVSDTGAGMDARTMERIFDPYFTTKEVGKGSGLGLAVVNGIVKRHEGAITVRSAPGKGTTFSIYIPRLETTTAVPVETLHKTLIGTESILLLDDEKTVVKMGTAILERLGYKVTTETDSLRALEIFSARPDEFDLIITDYTMPNLTGMDLAKEVRRIRRNMPILLCTGFSEKISHDSVKELGMELLMKPYGMRQIAEVVRKILDALRD